MNALKVWFLKNKKSALIALGLAAMFAVALIYVNSGEGSLSLAGSAGDVCDEAPLAENPRLGMVQASWGVNVRTGPGVGYTYVNPQQVGLPKCAIFEMLGRNQEATWLLVSSQKPNLTGWIALGRDWNGIPWEKININVNDLPVSTTTFGSQSSSGSGSGGTGYGGPIPDDYISIGNGMIASGKVGELPANQQCTVMLYPAGKVKKAVAIWQGSTNSEGEIGFQAPMPSVWADGSNVEYGSLTIAFYVNGTAERSWNLSYQK